MMVLMTPKRSTIILKRKTDLLRYPNQSTPLFQIIIRNHLLKEIIMWNLLMIYGRPAWEIKNDYSRRLLAENFMGRFKGIFGSRLRARNIDSQKVEAMIGCSILNSMTALGVPTTLAKAA